MDDDLHDDARIDLGGRGSRARIDLGGRGSRDRIDLSALDPARDPARWGALITKVAARAAARRRATLSRAVAGFGVPAFGLAAAAALAIWLLAPPRGVPAIAPQPVSVSDGLIGWALQGEPDGASLLSSLGGTP